MNNHQHNILTLMNYLSSSESDDDELINYIIKQPVIRPTISNFMNVIHSYSDKQVSSSILITHFFYSLFCIQIFKFALNKRSKYDLFIIYYF